MGRRLNKASSRAKERQQLGGASAHIIVWLDGRLAKRVPVFSRLGNGLIGAGFILAPQLYPGRLSDAVPVLHQVRLRPNT